MTRHTNIFPLFEFQQTLKPVSGAISFMKVHIPLTVVCTSFLERDQDNDDDKIT